MIKITFNTKYEGIYLALTVKRSNGIVVEYGGNGVVFDPSRNQHKHPVFVSHAHADHAAAFRYPNITKYSTEPTSKLLSIYRWNKLENWRQISIGDSIKIGELEIHAHNAGHVLGSAQFEIITPEGTVLYTGDFSLGNSYTMKSAPVVDCDLLVIETTFGAPMFKFPKRKDVALDIVRWAVMETLPTGKIPTLRTDAIGNAQEIITLFNNLTKVPVVTVKNVTKISDIYRNYGIKLDYVASDSPEGRTLIESGKCIMVAPKNAKLELDNLETALASGWAVMMQNRGKAFPLSDHADFRELISYIRRCHPKRVLTFHGGAMTKGFSDYIRKRLGIDARPLTSREESILGRVGRKEIRLKTCYEQLLKTIRIPGFEYSSTWLVKEMARKGFKQSETQLALQHLIKHKVLEATHSGVRLT